MIGGGKTLIVWGGLLVVNTIILWTVFSPDASSVALLGGAGIATMLVGAGALLAGRSRGIAPDADHDRSRTVPDLSLATVWTSLSLVLLLLAGEMGPWLAYVAGGMLLLGLGGLAREFRAVRHEVETGQAHRGGSIAAETESAAAVEGAEGRA